MTLEAFGAGARDFGYAIAGNGGKRVVFTGSFTGPVDFGIRMLTSAGSSDAFCLGIVP